MERANETKTQKYHERGTYKKIKWQGKMKPREKCHERRTYKNQTKRTKKTKRQKCHERRHTKNGKDKQIKKIYSTWAHL